MISDLYFMLAMKYFLIHFLTQRDALYDRIKEITHTAWLCGVNVICYQEAWSELVCDVIHCF